MPLLTLAWEGWGRSEGSGWAHNRPRPPPRPTLSSRVSPGEAHTACASPALGTRPNYRSITFGFGVVLFEYCVRKGRVLNT